MSKHREATFVATLIFTLLVAMALAGPAAAQLPGHLFGQIFDEKGEGVEGVQIVVTDPESPSFREVHESGKNGRYNIMFKSSLPNYTLEFSKEGYQTFTINGVNIEARKRTRRNFEIKSVEAALAAGEAAGDVDAEAAAAASAATDVFNEGVLAYNAQDWITAEQKFKEALEAKPDLAQAHAALARTYWQTKEHEKAIEAAQAALAAGTDSSDMNQVLFDSYSALGKEDEAQEALAAMQAGDPSKAANNLFNQAAEAYNGGDIEGAKATLQQVLALNADHAKANYMMGLVMVSEDPVAAKAYLEKFLAIAPNDPDAATAKEMLQYLE